MEGKTAVRRTYQTPELFQKLPWLRWVLASLVPLYIWSLPALAHVCDDYFPVVVPSTEPSTTSRCLVFRCQGYPACSDSPAGVTVSSFISTPPATGMFVLAFLYPFSKMFYIASFQSGMWGMASLIVYTASFGLFTVFNSYYYPALHGTFQDVVMIAGMWHYFTIMKDATPSSAKLVKLLICLTIIDFVGVLVVYNLPGGSGQYSPYLYFPFEAFGLSCIALVPAMFDQEVSYHMKHTSPLAQEVGANFGLE